MEKRELKKAESIKADYTEKKKTKLHELIELDRRVKRPAEIFAYTFGSIGSLVLGAGMSFAMKVIGQSLSFAMPLGIAVGCVGIAMVSVNYFLYKKILSARKKKYAAQIIRLSDEIIGG